MKIRLATPRTHLRPTTSDPTPAARPPMSAPSVVELVMSSFWPFERTAGPRSPPIEMRAPEIVPVS
jgi:hypothetical protein